MKKLIRIAKEVLVRAVFGNRCASIHSRKSGIGAFRYKASSSSLVSTDALSGSIDLSEECRERLVFSGGKHRRISWCRPSTFFLFRLPSFSNSLRAMGAHSCNEFSAHSTMGEQASAKCSPGTSQAVSVMGSHMPDFCKGGQSVTGLPSVEVSFPMPTRKQSDEQGRIYLEPKISRSHSFVVSPSEVCSHFRASLVNYRSVLLASFVLVACLILPVNSSAQSLTTITGTIRDGSGALVTSGQVSFNLKPGIDTVASGITRFSPIEVDCLINGSGLVKALDGTSACTLVQNTSIQPSGTSWVACIQPQFTSPGSCFVFYAIGASLDITTTPATPSLTPAYSLVDVFSNQVIAGNKTFTGTTSFSAAQTLAQINKSIWVDGTKYPVTQVGIQSAFTDACALTGGVRGGTTIYLPLGVVTVSNTSAQQFLVTCPVRIIGPGPSLLWFVVANTVPNTVPLFRLKPAAADQGFYQIEGGFRVTSGGAFGGDAFFLDSTNAGVQDFRLQNVEIDGLDNAAWCVNMTAGIADQFFFGNIRNNQFNCGIKLNTSSTADSWLIDHNTFGSVAGNTLPCIDASTEVGASHITAFNNNGGCAGGFFISHGTTQCKILYNQVEQPIASTEANSAIIDLIGDTYAIDGCEIVGNNINAHTFATRNIRLGTASNTHIEGNVIAVKATTGIGIDLDAGAATLTRMPWNEFTGTGGGAVAIKNSFNVTNFATRGSDGTVGAPTYSFANNTDRGMYNVSSVMVLVFGGADVMAMNGGGPFLGSAMGYGWSSNTDPVAAGQDTGVSRNAAGTVCADTSTIGNCAGTYKATGLNITGNGTISGNATVKRFLLVGTVPTCSVTGAGTGATCAVTTGSTDSGGQMNINTGTTPSASGTITLTFSSSFGANASACAMTLANGAEAWNARATIIGTGSSTTTAPFAWNNNAVSLTGSASGDVAVTYFCGGR